MGVGVQAAVRALAALRWPCVRIYRYHAGLTRLIARHGATRPSPALNSKRLRLTHRPGTAQGSAPRRFHLALTASLAMDRPSAAAPTAQAQGTALAVQQKEDARTSAMEPPPRALIRAGFQGVESSVFVRREKDMIDDDRCQLERRDTTDSCQSEFAPPQRTNTGWSSVAGSTATDMTDVNSPDLAFADDGLDLETEIYASSPRRSGLFPPLIPLQKRLPLRALSISSETDKSRTPHFGLSPAGATPTPIPPHRRLGQVTSRKSSLSRSAFGMPQLPTPEDTPEEKSARAEDEQMPEEIWEWEEEMDDGPKEENAPTPGGAMADVDTPSASDEGAAGSAAPGERPGSRCSEPQSLSSDGDGSARPAPNLHAATIHEVCDQILQQAFGVQFHDLASAGAVSAVYDSVSYCLDELSHIVLNSGLSSAGVVVHESTRGRTSSAAIPMQPAGGVVDSEGSNSANGGGHGNGGGRKRANGGNDGANSGDGSGDDSPGSGKRQKILPPLANMQLSCPFRKRNPIRFNIRVSQSCAQQSFPDISLLK